MKRLKVVKRQLLLVAVLALLLPLLAWGEVIVIVDDQFADGNSLNQDLEHNSLRVFNGRPGTVRTDAVGSVTFDVTNAGGSEGFWAFFTEVEKPIKLNVGDKLTVAGTFSVHGFPRNGQDLRFGIFDSGGTRTTEDDRLGQELRLGMSHPSFVGDTGYMVQFFASGTGMPLRIRRRTELASQGIFNSISDFTEITTEATGATERQEIAEDTPYTLSFTIERLTDVQTRLSAEVTGGKLTDLNYSVVETASPPDILPNTSFDYFGFRIKDSSFASILTFTRLRVVYTRAETPAAQ